MHELRRSKKQPTPQELDWKDFEDLCEQLSRGHPPPLTQEDAELVRQVAADDRPKFDAYVVGKSFEKNLLSAASEEKLPEIDAAVAEMNKRHSLVNEAGKVWIFRDSDDRVAKRKYYQRISAKDFKLMCENQPVLVGHDGKGNEIYKTSDFVWLKHQERRQYLDGVIFDPSGTQHEGTLNLWRGFDMKPEAGEWPLMKAHIRDIICGGNEEYFAYLMGWMARLLQQPEKQGEVAVVMRGGQGVGKGTLAKALRRIIGQHSLLVASSKALVGNFNLHLRDCIFLFADEAFFAGDKQHVGTLKSFITEDELFIEGKGMNAIKAKNYLHIMMASNADWVVPAERDDRRFFVLDVPETRQDDKAYFQAITDEMESGGYAAMMHELLELDISAFRHRDVPQTEGLRRQKLLTLKPDEQFYYEGLKEGFFEGCSMHWESFVVTKELHAAYLKNERGYRPISLESFGEFLKRVSASEGTRKRTKAVNGRGYELGSLADARADFEAYLRMPGGIDWPATSSSFTSGRYEHADRSRQDDAPEKFPPSKSARVIELRELYAKKNQAKG